MFLKYQFQVNDVIKILSQRENEIQNNVKYSVVSKTFMNVAITFSY